jgi:hypothetical protein
MPTHDAKQAARALRYRLTLALLAAPRPRTVSELIDRTKDCPADLLDIDP